MADRICSCCGAIYTDEEIHDYEKCFSYCEWRVKMAGQQLAKAKGNMKMARGRRQLQRDGKLNKGRKEAQ